MEIYSGKDTRISEKKEIIEVFLANFRIIILTQGIAKRAGELRRDHQKPFADMIIAASAMEYGMPLVTRNIKHFRTIRGLKVLRPY